MWGEALEPVLLASFLDYFAMACYMCEPLGQMVQSLEYLFKKIINWQWRAKCGFWPYSDVMRALEHVVWWQCTKKWAEGEPECRVGTKVSRWEWKTGDRSRELGMWEASRGRLRNDSGFWAESLEFTVKPLKDKGTREEEQVWEGKLWSWVARTLRLRDCAHFVPSGPMRPGATTCECSTLLLTCLLAI